MKPRAELVDTIKELLTSSPKGYAWWQFQLGKRLGLTPSEDEIRIAMNYLRNQNRVMYKTNRGWQAMPPGLRMYYRMGEELARRNK